MNGPCKTERVAWVAGDDQRNGIFFRCPENWLTWRLWAGAGSCPLSSDDRVMVIFPPPLNLPQLS